MNEDFHKRMSMRLFGEKDEEGFSFNAGGTGGIDDLDEYESVYSDIEEDEDAFGFTAKGEPTTQEEAPKKKETMAQQLARETLAMQSTMASKQSAASGKRSSGRTRTSERARTSGRAKAPPKTLETSGTVFESTKSMGPKTSEENPSKIKAVFAMVKDTVKRSKKSFMIRRESNAETETGTAETGSVASSRKPASRKATIEEDELEEKVESEQRKVPTGAFGFFKKGKTKTMKPTTPEERNRIAKQVTKIFDDNTAEPQFEYVNPKVPDPEEVEVESANFHEMLHYGYQTDIVVKKKIQGAPAEEVVE